MAKPGIAEEWQHNLPSLDAYWMPYTCNRQFKKDPRLIARADGCYFHDVDGRAILDSASGLVCSSFGHNRPEIIEAMTRQLHVLDYVPPFQFGHPSAFELASVLKDIMPDGLDRIFFTNSGSESVDTALKMARAYWRLKGRPGKVRLIGRGRGCHGANSGGTSVGGIGLNRKMYGSLVEADHLRHTLLAENTFSRGIPGQGIELAEELEEIIALHDASNVAAVILEPVSVSGGVIIPPDGYLKRIREICDKHEVLLIFDEVITGFGRTGAAFGGDRFDVIPDIMTVAKNLTNAAVPMGAVATRKELYDLFMEQGGKDYLIEFFHGYTNSGHPLACAAGLAAMRIFVEDKMVQRVRDMAPYFEDAMHSLAELPRVVDIRNIGMVAAIQIEAIPGDPARRPFDVMLKCWEKGLYARCGGDVIVVAPPFIADRAFVDDVTGILHESITDTD